MGGSRNTIGVTLLGGLKGLVVIVLSPICFVGCTNQPGLAIDETALEHQQAVSLLDVATLIQDQWQELPLNGNTEYRVVSFDGDAVVWAKGRNSASGLIRFVEFDVNRCDVVEWSWRVEYLQRDADLRLRSKDDVAASIFMMFGDPGLLSDPDPVPTLRYVWTNDKAVVNTVIENPYMPDIVRNVVVRAGGENLGEWMTESRNLVDDYKRAFGSPPIGKHPGGRFVYRQ